MNCSINKKKETASLAHLQYLPIGILWQPQVNANILRLSTIWAIEVLLKIHVTKISDAARLQYD